MEILEDQLNESFLSRLAAEAVSLLCVRDFATLTQRFSYALAHNREPAAAVAIDLARCFTEAPSVEAAMAPDNARYKVRHFEPNDVPLHALVECRFTSASDDTLLVELVVIGKGRMALLLEQISVFPAEAAA